MPETELVETRLLKHEGNVVWHEWLGNDSDPIKVYADGRHILVIDDHQNPVYETDMSTAQDVSKIKHVLGLMEYGARGLFEDPA